MLTAEAVGELVTASRHGAWQAVMEQLPALVSTVEACLESLGAAPGVQADATCALLLQCLRALRNLCAGGAAAAEAVVVEHGTLSAVARLLELVECAAIQLDWQLPAVTAQLLANAAAAGGAGCAAAVWSAAFPRQLNVLAHVNTGERVYCSTGLYDAGQVQQEWWHQQAAAAGLRHLREDRGGSSAKRPYAGPRCMPLPAQCCRRATGPLNAQQSSSHNTLPWSSPA